MKNTLIILTLFCLIFSCKDDTIKTPGIGFSPLTVINGEEDSPTTHTIALEVSGIIASDATVSIGVTNGDFLTTVPALSNGTLSLVIPAGERNTSFTVTIGDDNLVKDYFATFKIKSIGGAINSILPSNQFTIVIADIDQKAYFSDDFERGSLCKWITFDASGSNNWEIGMFDNNSYAIASNFNSTGLADDWLIMPEINFDNFENEFLVFSTLTAFNNNNTLEVVVLTDYNGTGDPSVANKIALNPVLDPHRGGGFGNFTLSTKNPNTKNEEVLDLSSMTGTAYIAFHFKALDANDGTQWQVDNVLLSVNDQNKLITVEGGANCGSGGGGGGSMLNSLYSDDFEDCVNAGIYNIPIDWIEEFIPGSKTDRGWGCSASVFGRNSTNGIRGSAFGGNPGTDDAWLISASVFDLTSVTNSELKFWVEGRFTERLGELTVLWSTNYTGSGNPNNATWTELTNATTQITALTAAVFTEITVSLNAIAGNNIYLAFRYAGGTDSSSKIYTLDDFSITGM